MGKSRLEAFSDGVLAIIITIMVLEMKVPHGDSLETLAPLVPVFMSYVLSFVYLGIYWNNHHHMLHTVTRVTGGVLWANLHLLFWLSLFPFVTGWMGENHFAAIPSALYGGVLLAATGRASFRRLCTCWASSPLSFGHGWGRRCMWRWPCCGWCLTVELKGPCIAMAPAVPEAMPACDLRVRMPANGPWTTAQESISPISR